MVCGSKSIEECAMVDVEVWEEVEEEVCEKVKMCTTFYKPVCKDGVCKEELVDVCQDMFMDSCNDVELVTKCSTSLKEKCQQVEVKECKPETVCTAISVTVSQLSCN